MDVDTHSVIEIMKKSNYFYAWEEILLGVRAGDDWKVILQNREND